MCLRSTSENVNPTTARSSNLIGFKKRDITESKATKSPAVACLAKTFLPVELFTSALYLAHRSGLRHNKVNLPADASFSSCMQ
eukprot:SAG31_NODE_2772_length_5116_cov_2.136336_6_plen_83_part_00